MGGNPIPSISYTYHGIRDPGIHVSMMYKDGIMGCGVQNPGIHGSRDHGIQHLMYPYQVIYHIMGCGIHTHGIQHLIS